MDGDPTVRRRGRRPPPVEERFWSKVDRRGPDECWPWTGATNQHGYGIMTIDQRQVGAHRVSLALDGRDPGPLDAIHSCDNPPCVNPAHLRPATTRENVADMIAKERGHWQNRQIVQVG